MEFLSTCTGSSYYKLISKFWMGQSNSNDRPIHRICNLMRKMEARTLIAEIVDPADDVVREEIGALRTYFNNDLKTVIYRLTFSTNTINDFNRLIDKSNKRSFLSNVTIINMKTGRKRWRSYIYSSIIKIPTQNFGSGDKGILNNYLHNARDFKCSIKSGDGIVHHISIFGDFFCQQNGFTSVCAHAALCMTVNNLEFNTSKLLSSEFINQTLNIDHVTKKLGMRNVEITTTDIELLLTKLGYSVTIRNFLQDPPSSKYSEYLYRYIESRCPSLLLFSARNSLHIVPIVGHTLNTDLWTPEAERAYSSQIGKVKYKNASAWVDNFIIHDDNYGAYCTLPVDTLWKFISPRKKMSFRAVLGISIIPKGVTTPAEHSEWANITLLETIITLLKESKADVNYWINQLSSSVLKKKNLTPFVARTFLVKKEEYKNNLSQKDYEGVRYTAEEITEILQNLPEIFWLTEISLPDLYTTNKTKIADFMYKSDISSYNAANVSKDWIKVRLPELLLEKTTSNVKTYQLGVKSHFPLLKHSGEPIPHEW